MMERSKTLARAARLRMNFEAAGAQVVEPPLLQPAGTLLDLYGEDIRARAYVTSDAVRGEQMLRPDFTLPVVQMHMRQGADPARYTYAGEVFRRQEHDPDRANEYLQVGYEVFDRDDPAGADAEVFALIALQLRGLPLRAATGHRYFFSLQRREAPLSLQTNPIMAGRGSRTTSTNAVRLPFLFVKAMV